MTDQTSNVVPFPGPSRDALAVVTDTLNDELPRGTSAFVLAVLIVHQLIKAGFMARQS
jgi:hypothetical protein